MRHISLLSYQNRGLKIKYGFGNRGKSEPTPRLPSDVTEDPLLTHCRSLLSSAPTEAND